MAGLKTAFDVRSAEEDLGFEIEAFLRKRGWKHTCQTPGSFWLWERKLDDGRTILVERGLAVSMQEHFDAAAEAASGEEER